MSEDPPNHEFLSQLAAHSPKKSRYQRRTEIARGGMGAILEVWDQDLRRSLAMKVIHGGDEQLPAASTLDASILSRFLEEAQVTGQLDHPGIVPIHELGIDSEERLYYTMPLVDGVTLKDVFDRIKQGEDDWNEVRALGVVNGG